VDPNRHQTPPSYLDNLSGAFYDPIFSGARPDLRIALCTKKRVAYVCYFARDAARAIEGGFWTLADEVWLYQRAPGPRAGTQSSNRSLDKEEGLSF
jgi:hypothetical protein